MVFYYKSRCGEYTIYMGKDKHENEDLIKFGLDEDVWFHVDDLSSAHVYARLKAGMSLDDLSDDLITDCASLVKANSIQGCKRTSVYVIYTRWKNLKKTSNMVAGAVAYHRPDNVRRVLVEKNNTIVRQIEKTKKELFPDLCKEQQDRLNEIQRGKKQEYKRQAKEKQMRVMEAKREKEERSYDRIQGSEDTLLANQVEATVDATAAEEYEDDFF